MHGDPNFKNLTKDNYGRPPESQHGPLQELIKPHTESFNYVTREGLTESVKDIVPCEFALPNGQKVAISIKDAQLSHPVVAQNNQFASDYKTYPAEARERGTTYKGPLKVLFQWEVDGRVYGPEEKVIGHVPIMVKSNVCNLHNLSPAGLVSKGEEAEEMGGYFIINGIERIIRMLIMPRRNFPTCMIRSSWKNRGPQYTDYGVSMRCVKADQTAANIVLHYLNNGTAVICFSHSKEQFFVPVVMILKSLVEVTDQFIYKELIKGREKDSFFKGCIANMLRQAQEEGMNSRKAVLKFIGERFRVKLQLPEWKTDVEVAEFLIQKCICIHLQNNMDKFNVIVFMIRKLFSYAKGECASESADNPMFQELLLGGHLYLMVLKEKIENWMYSLKTIIDRKSKSKGQEYTLDLSSMNEALKYGLDVSKSMEYLLATGNLVSKTGLGLMQASGLTVVADKLNFLRYISHFRCVHRGAFFAQMRTTAVRKLLPEAWGFLCPVHTPDGTPCGLMNHMSASCQTVNVTYQSVHIHKTLNSLGMHPYDSETPDNISQYYTVILDGKMVGWLHDTEAQSVVEKLRKMKVLGLEKIPKMLEICMVKKTAYSSQFPGLFLFTTTARMMRPVQNLALDKVEWIGSFEQVGLHICIIPEEAHPGLTTHQELSESSMLSAIASLTPYSDFNQSPRNMYQCQMGKQTMGFPLHAYQHRSDNKLYRIQTPQAPMVRPKMYDHYDVDNYPIGTNAVVCVISYTGYDMEDAMILNKASFERGFCHGSVLKSEFVDLKDISREKYKITLLFGCKPNDKAFVDGNLEQDGLPRIGTYLQQGDPYYSYINIQTGESKTVNYKSQEPAYVDQVKICGNDQGTGLLQRICVVLRINRNPIIGDKFASRHGQKGICSQKWPVENLPFSESGMVPDIIFNPHGFPSRMTIGMMIESMAGKAAAMHGQCYDATPFTFSEDQPAIDHFGQMLTSAGYNYYGTERMYSGVDGREFEADIFFGVVYYQRLRHMVSDKFQVRTTGPVDILTHQPVQGRKRGGGVRFGEMERDGLLAHGTPFLLQDRLLNCSDRSIGHVCTKCGSILSTFIEKPVSSNAAASFEAKRRWMCSVCKDKNTIQTVALPYVFRYLVGELAAMNIKVNIDIRQH